jgi:hypothetical protein
MSFASIGSDARYILPASYDSVPEAFRSNKSAKPIPCSLQTVNLPSLSGTQNLGGSAIIQVPCGASAGYMANPYVRFTIQLTGPQAGLKKDGTYQFKGATKSATACINRYATFVNSQMVDNLQNAWALYDMLLAHSTSQPWLSNDGNLMLGAGNVYTLSELRTVDNLPALHVCVPLLGLLGSQSAVPLFLVNGTLQIQLDFQSSIGSFIAVDGTNIAEGAITGCTFSEVQLVYDKISCEQAFVDSVRADMMKGNKFVFGYTNYQLTSVANQASANATFNYGLNVSSLRAVVMTQYETANLGSAKTLTPSIANNMSVFQVSLDGRQISNINHNVLLRPACSFAELQKCMGRLFDASISEVSGDANAAVAVDATQQQTSAQNEYNATRFAIGSSAQRINEGLAFSGTPCSVASIQYTQGAVAVTSYLTFISDQQLLVTADGSVELVR